MGTYRIAVKNRNDKHLCGFRYWLQDPNIPNAPIAVGNLKADGRTEIATPDAGVGNLYNKPL